MSNCYKKDWFFICLAYVGYMVFILFLLFNTNSIYLYMELLDCEDSVLLEIYDDSNPISNIHFSDSSVGKKPIIPSTLTLAERYDIVNPDTTIQPYGNYGTIIREEQIPLKFQTDAGIKKYTVNGAIDRVNFLLSIFLNPECDVQDLKSAPANMTDDNIKNLLDPCKNYMRFCPEGVHPFLGVNILQIYDPSNTSAKFEVYRQYVEAEAKLYNELMEYLLEVGYKF